MKHMHCVMIYSSKIYCITSYIILNCFSLQLCIFIESSVVSYQKIQRGLFLRASGHISYLVSYISHWRFRENYVYCNIQSRIQQLCFPCLAVNDINNFSLLCFKCGICFDSILCLLYFQICTLAVLYGTLFACTTMYVSLNSQF